MQMDRSDLTVPLRVLEPQLMHHSLAVMGCRHSVDSFASLPLQKSSEAQHRQCRSALLLRLLLLPMDRRRVHRW
jgi:hypothetical protein